jgi:predicted dienelactone hydrolase
MTFGEGRRLPTVIWYPTDGQTGAPVEDAPPAAGGPFPYVLYSHGNGGFNRGATYLAEHLASWGFVVASPNHIGNTDLECPAGCEGIELAQSMEERPGDMLAIQAGLLVLKSAGHPVGPAIDPSRGAATGFSLGGWTAVRAGADRGFDAVIAQAPGIRGSLDDVARRFAVPVMIMNAGKDAVVEPEGVRELYDQFPDTIPHYYVLLPEARHSSFHDICFEEACNSSLGRDRGHELVNRYATAFLLTYLTGDERYAAYLFEDSPPDAEVEYAGP